VSYRNPEALVSTEWLAAHLDAPDVRVVDGTYAMPDTGRDAHREYESAHIPGAVFFDIEEIADSKSPYPHMLPPPEKFSSRVRRLGLGDGNRIVVCDQLGLFSAARVWWMFRVFGHEDVAVLDGGLPKWRTEGRPLTDDIGVPGERHFTARYNSLLVRDFAAVKGNLAARHEQVVDARSPGRFAGTEPEPRPGLRSGHLPGARNLHYRSLLDERDQTMLPGEALERRFAEAGIDVGKPIVASCGSGVTACILALGLYLIGHTQVPVYDGSWAEWGARPEAPIETGGPG
jgi:thiosulfate/3-mercaptopyruvate sulfurtransferase